jgi:hypothetical protein
MLNKTSQKMLKTCEKKFLILPILLLISSLAYFSLYNVAASPAIGSMTTTIYSVADASVNSSSPDTNYGDMDYMYVKKNSEQRFTYAKFDLSSIPSDANIISAKLKLYLTDISGYTGNINTYYCSNSSWTELEVTWNNKPDFCSEATDENYFGMIVFVNRYYSWDVTADVQEDLSQGNLTEVIIRKSSGYARFQSKEGAHKPKLEVEYSTKPVFVIHLESVQETGATANLGFITCESYVFSLPTDIDIVNGSYAITYSGGYTFVRWETTDGVTVLNENAVSTTVTVLGNGTLRAVGSVKKLEYAYDHGNPRSHSETAGRMDAVRFTPIFSDQLLTARYYMYDLSSYQSNTFKVHVMDESRNDILTPFNVTPTSEGWFDVDLSSYGMTVNDGVDFYLGMEWIVSYNPDLGEDVTSPSGRSWRWNGTVWDVEEYKDFMIRAVVGTATPEVDVGVKVGDWVGTNDAYFEWVSNWPGYETPPSENMSWMKMEVLEVHDSNITVQSAVMYANGTVEEYINWGDIATGEGNLSVMIIPSNLDAGDEIPANLTWYTEEPLKLFVNGTIIKNYAGANREVNYVNITYPMIYGNVTYGGWNMSFYWDKKTGFLLEEDISCAMSLTINTTHYYLNMSTRWKVTLTEMWPAVFTIEDGYSFEVTMISNSSISNFDFNETLKQISFNVTGPPYSKGYCNVTIPKDLLQGNPWTILLNDTDCTSLCDITGNDTHTFIYIPYACSTNAIKIEGTLVIPEFPSTVILPLIMILTMLAVSFTRKKVCQKPRR